MVPIDLEDIAISTKGLCVSIEAVRSEGNKASYLRKVIRKDSISRFLKANFSSSLI